VPAELEESQAEHLANEDRANILNGIVDEIAQEQYSLTGIKRAYTNHSLTANESIITSEASAGDEMDDVSDWEGFNSRDEIEEGHESENPGDCGSFIC
jgi:phage-related baseplate assembly protein